MRSTNEKKSPRSPVSAFLAFLALLLLALVGFVLWWPTLKPLPFDPDAAYRLAEGYHRAGRWDELENQLRLLASFQENTRFNETVWVRWLNLARRLGRATQRWEPLLLLARKALAELPGNPILKTFSMYARIRARDFNEPLPKQSELEAANPIYRRLLLDYHSWLYFQNSKQSGLFDPRELLTSKDLGFWSQLADAFPDEPSFNARALLLALGENNSELFLRYLTSLELGKRQHAVFRNWEAATIDKLVGLASFRLGRWETALTFLRRSRSSLQSDSTASLALAEAAYRLGQLSFADRVLDEELRVVEADDEKRAQILHNLAFIALFQADLGAIRGLSERGDLPKDLQFYLQIVLTTGEAGKRNLQKKFLEYLSSQSEPSVSAMFFYYASFPDLLTPTLLNTELSRYLSREEQEAPYLQALVEMLLWQLNREGKFFLTLETADKWSRTWPNSWFLNKEKALALAQLSGRANEAYDLWNTASMLDRNLYWEYNASRLAANLVRAQNNQRGYDRALAHNFKAEALSLHYPNTPALRRFLAQIFLDRSVWLYYSGKERESREALVQARRLDPNFLAAQAYLDTALLKEISDENQN